MSSKCGPGDPPSDGHRYSVDAVVIHIARIADLEAIWTVLRGLRPRREGVDPEVLLDQAENIPVGIPARARRRSAASTSRSKRGRFCSTIERYSNI